MQLIFVANMDADEVLRSLANVNATTDVQHRPIGGTTYVYQVLALVVTFRIPQITHHSAVLFRTVRSAFCIPQFRILPTPIRMWLMNYADFLRVGYMKNKLKVIYCISKSFNKAYRRDI